MSWGIHWGITMQKLFLSGLPLKMMENGIEEIPCGQKRMYNFDRRWKSKNNLCITENLSHFNGEPPWENFHITAILFNFWSKITFSSAFVPSYVQKSSGCEEWVGEFVVNSKLELMEFFPIYLLRFSPTTPETCQFGGKGL